MLINSTDLLVFLTAALSLNLTPGNDMMYVLGQSLKGGARSGISASLGIAGGSLIHLGFVALGVAVILAQIRLRLIRYGGLHHLDCTARLRHRCQHLPKMKAAQHICGFQGRSSGQPVQSQDHRLHVRFPAALHPAGKWFAAFAAPDFGNDFQCGRHGDQLRSCVVCGKNWRGPFDQPEFSPLVFKNFCWFVSSFGGAPYD
jgi:hypothetical protein